MRRTIILVLASMLCWVLILAPLAGRGAAQDGLNLPTELYVLLNEGQVERYGIGAAGVSTVTPEDEVVVDFGVAPDGVWLAYRTGERLVLYDMLNGEGSEIEGAASGVPPFRGRGQSMAWSPDGRALAYTVETGLRFYFDNGTFFDVPVTPIRNLQWSPDGTYILAEASDAVWWVYRRENNQMVLHAVLPGPTDAIWVDTTVLLFTPVEGGLLLMDVGAANAQASVGDPEIVFRRPVLRADGSVVLFGNPVDDTSITDTAGYLYGLRFDGTYATERIAEQSVELEGLRWAPAGELMVALSGGVLALVDPNTAQGIPLPVSGVATYGWGGLRPPGVDALPLPEPVYLLAPDVVTQADTVWRLPEDGSFATPVTFTEADITDFAVSPSADAVAYHADGRLWLLPNEADEATLLAEVAAVDGMSFSPDGGPLVYGIGEAIFSVAFDGGEPVQLLLGYTQPQFVPGQDAMLLRITADGDLGYSIPSTGEVRRLGAFEQAVWLSGGLIAAVGAPTADGLPGIYVLDPSGQVAPTQVYAPITGQSVADLVEASPDQLRIVLVREGVGPGVVEVLDLPLGGAQPVVRPSPGFLIDPRLSPDGRYLGGYAGATGVLALYDLEQQVETVIRQPAEVQVFRWSAFR